MTVTEKDAPAATKLAGKPTPSTNRSLPFCVSDAGTLSGALDYAAQGETGYNFFDLRGGLKEALSFASLRERSLEQAKKLSAKFPRGSRLAVVAETSADFVVAFFACQYAGMIPAPMPMPVNLGGKDGYLNQIRQMITGAQAEAAIGPETLKDFLKEATDDIDDVEVLSFADVNALTETAPNIPFADDEECYIQYSSGSTSAPKGVIGTQRSVTSNLRAISHDGLHTREGDRGASWLPLYHDMGLIGFLLTPMISQLSVDFIATSDFVRRPLLWLRIITEQKCTLTYSPSFGYDLAAKRSARAEPGAIDLSTLRVAGIGGDMVRAEALNSFADAFEACGFNRTAFAPSYGMAEATLAISFPELSDPIQVDEVDMRHYTRSGVAQPASAITAPDQKRGFVLCGKPLKNHAIEVRGENGDALEERQVGRIFIKGPSLTPGYFSDPEASAAMYHGEWLDTGDMGYFLDGQIVITGRAKDLIIINGRNIWPQDIEWATEKVAGVRSGGVAAFSVDDGNGERIVAIVERRGMDESARAELKREVASVVQNAVGAPAEIVLVRPHSMVVTSSGKLSRAKVKQKYLGGEFAEDMAESAASPALAEARG